MEALVVYESMYGNTRKVADAIADGLCTRVNVRAVEVGVAPRRIDDQVALVVVGGPTHAFGMSRASTRADAAEDSPVISNERGIREWLGSVQLPAAVRVATFDTKMIKPRLPGSAAAAAARHLRRKGAKAIADPATFYVTGKHGPPAAGELDRARRWGAVLASEAGRASAMAA